MLEGSGEGELAKDSLPAERRREIADNLRNALGGNLDPDFDLGRLVGLKRIVDETGRQRTEHTNQSDPPKEWDEFRRSLDTTGAGIVTRAITAAYRVGISTVGQLRSVTPEQLQRQRNINVATASFLKDAFHSTLPPGEAMLPEEV